jgi:uncharacterized membrane protein HdeD (DUF308 family)
MKTNDQNPRKNTRWHDILNTRFKLKHTNMKVLGTILIIAGILMLIFTNISFTKEEKVLDVGPVEINKKEKKTIDWPNYAGGIAVVAGVILLVTGKKRNV